MITVTYTKFCWRSKGKHLAAELAPRGQAPRLNESAFRLLCGNRVTKGVADDLGRAFRLGLRHIQVRAGANRLRSGKLNKQPLLLKDRRHLLGAAQVRIDLEEHQIGFHIRRVKQQAGGIGDGLSDNLSMLMVVRQSINLVFQGEQGARGRHARLAHAASEHLADALAAGDKLA